MVEKKESQLSVFNMLRTPHTYFLKNHNAMGDKGDVQ